MSVIDHAVRVKKLVRHEKGGALRHVDARNLFRRTLESFQERWALDVHGWAILPARIELVLSLPFEGYDAKADLNALFGYFTRRYNRRYGKVGPLLRSMFGIEPLAGPHEICVALDEIHRLPSTLKLHPGTEPWSSVHVYDRGTPDRAVTPFLPALLLTEPPPMRSELRGS